MFLLLHLLWEVCVWSGCRGFYVPAILAWDLCGDKTVLCLVSSPPTTPGLPLSQQQFNLLCLYQFNWKARWSRFGDQGIFQIIVEPLNNTAVALTWCYYFWCQESHRSSFFCSPNKTHFSLEAAHSEHGAPPKYKKRKQSFSAAAMAHGVLWTCVVLFGRAVQTAAT